MSDVFLLEMYTPDDDKIRKGSRQAQGVKVTEHSKKLSVDFSTRLTKKIVGPTRQLTRTIFLLYK